MKVAIEGCCHGELDKIYQTIEVAKNQAGIEAPDVLICCGDFQSFRNHSDLQTFAAPAKYRQLGTFWQYYSGEKVAPILTIFVGGNHEASGYLWELYHGGWVAPNIYFLGFAGSLILKKVLPNGLIDSIRISGASGIYKRHDYAAGHYERLPYDKGAIRSIYHVREYDIFRLCQLPIASSSDIFVSHDWPVGIEQYGNTAQLLRAKPFFKDEVASNTLGSPPLMHLLKTIKPHYWFSAHLHVKFAALYHHGQRPQSHRQSPVKSVALNPDELSIDDEDEDDDDVKHKHSSAYVKPPLLNPDMIPIDDSDEDERKNSPTMVKLAAINPDAIEIDDSDGEIVPEGQSLDPFSQSIGSHVDSFSEPLTSNLALKETGSHEKRTEQVPVPPAADRRQEAEKVSCLQNIQTSTAARSTRFLALDKCLPRKDFLQILDIPPPDASTKGPAPSSQPGSKQETEKSINDFQSEPNTIQNSDSSTAKLFFDPHWLAITRAFHPFLPLQQYENPKLPTDRIAIQKLIDQELEWVKHNIDPEVLEVNHVQQFAKTAPGIGDPGGEQTGQPLWYTNPQTLALTDLLKIENKINPPFVE